jgi:hypothetical protein
MVPFVRLAVCCLFLGTFFLVRRRRRRRTAKYSLAFLFAPLLFAALPAVLGLSVDALYSIFHFGEPWQVSLGVMGLVAGGSAGILFQVYVTFSGAVVEPGAAADRGNVDGLPGR